MPERKLYLGSVGPFLYDDDVPVGDPDGDFTTTLQDSIVTNGNIYAEGIPTRSNHLVRLTDLHGHLLTIRSLTYNNYRQLKGMLFEDIIKIRVFN